MFRIFRFLALCWAAALLAGCANHPPMATVDYVDLEKFMGDWYVIANIPIFAEKGAHNAVENYRLNEDGEIEVTFTFRADAFDGKAKEYNPKGFVKDKQSNALWDMQFLWPFKADYRIVYLDDEYTQVIIARRARDYVWLMARNPSIAEEDFKAHQQRIAELGYDTEKLERVPQRWPEKE